VLLLMPAGGRAEVAEAAEVRLKPDATHEDEWAGPAVPAPPAHSAHPASPALPAPQAVVPPPAPPAPPAHRALPALSILTAAAELATDFGRVRDLDDLRQLLSRTATVMDATGLVVWLGNLDGADLRPLLAHGYSEQTLARIAPVARTEGNAAAAAYRSGKLQIVVSKPGSSGAIVAPILVPGGCVGALSAEFRGGETSESVQAVAVIVAAHLATILTMAPAEGIDTKAASG
jgi:hypothetical protein